MPKYLFAANYTAEGMKGVAKEGGSRRREAADQAMKKRWREDPGFYYDFGDHRCLHTLPRCPDHVSAAAVSVAR